jgi:hypothetical protein
MEIKLDWENKQLKIDDNLKFNYWMLKFVMILNIFQMLMRVFKAPVADWNFYTWFWIPLGIVSIFMLFYISRLSTAEVIPVEDIQDSISKNFFGRKRLSLKLKNGKTRHLPTKLLKEMEQIQNFIDSPQKV